MLSRVLTVAGHEYVTNVRRKEFILITLGLPVVMLLFAGISALGAGMAVRDAFRKGHHLLGVINESSGLDLRRAARELPELEIKEYAALDSGLADVRAGKIQALLVIPKEYLPAGRVRLYRQSDGIFSRTDAIPIRALLTRALLARARVSEEIATRVLEPAARMETLTLDRQGAFSRRDALREASRFIVPYVFSILLVTAIFISASYLLRGIADEKENRVIEIVLSSVTAEELLLGKLIGLAGVGLTQVGVWLALAAVPATLIYSRYIDIGTPALAALSLFFVLGFALYATLMAGLGALGTSYRETQQISGIVSLFAFFPFFLLPALLQYPNGTLARALSFIPFTAPTTMAIRITSAEVPWADILISALLAAAAVWFVHRLSVKLFRFGLLIYGKRPTFSETVRWLRQS